GSNPGGRITHAGTSVPSGAIATKRSGADSDTSAWNAAPTSVSTRSPTNTSASVVGVVAVWTIVSPTTSTPVSPPPGARSTCGGALPSAGTSYRGTRPSSSTTKMIRSPSQMGGRTSG